MRPRAALPGLALMAALAACGPVPVEQAERQCLSQAQLAQHPRGSVAVGTTSHGPAARVDLRISGDFLMGRDPDQVYSECVYRRAGQLPRNPLSSQPAWKG